MEDNLKTLYSTEDKVADYGIDVPAWIDQDIDASQVAAIIHGGCDSGAYMPAVTYHKARETMARHGNDVWEFLEGHHGEEFHPPPGARMSWDGLACYYVSAAVETWAGSIAQDLADAIVARMIEAEDSTPAGEVTPT